MKRRYRRHPWYWLLELLRGQTKADLDYKQVLGATLALARSDLTDEEARERLHEVARSSEFGAEGVVEEFERKLANRTYDSYVEDRAYRLAKSVMTGQTVEPQDPALREQFRLEEELGRLPLDLAFERLASLVPELNEWRTAVEEDGMEIHVAEMKRLEKIVGPHADQPDVLARSHLGKAVATEYLSVLAGNTSRGDIHTPYFVLIKRPSTTVVFDRRKPSDPTTS